MPHNVNDAPAQMMVAGCNVGKFRVLLLAVLIRCMMTATAVLGVQTVRWGRVGVAGKARETNKLDLKGKAIKNRIN